MPVAFEEQIHDLEYTAELNGTVNGQPIVVRGRGTIRPAEGITNGDYDLEALPDGFSPLFLTTVLITGYPNACASLDGSPNLFQGISYDYQRTISFRDGNSLLLNTTCDLMDRRLRSTFALDGQVPKVSLQNVEPLVETWEAVRNGEIEGSFKIAWRQTNGSLLSAEAHSQYYVNRKTQGLPLVHRFIEIKSHVEGGCFSLWQRSFTFRRLEPK